MARTPPTIVAPLPRDPRVMELAKSLNISRREAFAAAVEAWTWMMMMERDGVVPDAVPDSIDGAVDIPGFGQSMLQAGLVGVVNDGLVLPGELRHQQRDERGGPAAATDDRGGDREVDPKVLRRRESNNVSARKSRRKRKLLGKKAKPSGNNAWRSLGRVAGHEVRVKVGPHGPYAMVLGATVNGQLYSKLTTKVDDMDAVKLTDVLPALVSKWKDQSRPRGLETTGPTLVPSYADFRDDADRLTVLAKLEAAEAAAGTARHADGDDASARHADASAASARPSADPDADGERKSAADRGLDASAASADRHADAPSSKSFSSTSSSSNEEEDIGDEGRKAAAADHERDQGHTAEPEGMAEYDKRQGKRRMMAQRFAEVLGEDVESILRLLTVNKPYLRSRLEAAGIDPNTGLRVAHGAPDEPAGARDDIGMTTASSGDDMPAAGSVGARGGEPPEFTVSHEDLRRGLRQQGVPLPTVKTPPAEDDAYVDGVSVGA